MGWRVEVEEPKGSKIWEVKNIRENERWEMIGSNRG